MGNVAVLLISLGLILIGAELFTNGVEWLGKRLNLSEGAVGSVLAAVGTALPETMIPVIALIGGGAEAVNIGTGAILGAPLMLSTLAMFVTGFAIVAFKRRREDLQLSRSQCNEKRSRLFPDRICCCFDCGNYAP